MALRIFFHSNILILIYFFKYKTFETHDRPFLPLNISAVGSVLSNADTAGIFSISYSAIEEALIS